MLMFVWMNWIGIHKLSDGTDNQQLATNNNQLLLALSIGMIGLSISGLVLHSFVDRMVVYPFCMIFGVLLCYQEKVLQAQEKTLPLV
jgi:undecaprenyl pyrophosphate phosphatase UppP